LAATRYNAEQMDIIEQCFERLEEVTESGALGVDTDFDLHMAIARASFNRYFEETLASLRESVAFGMNLARSLSLRRPAARLRQVQSEHRALIDAIAARDAERARTLMTVHIDNARRRIFEGEASTERLASEAGAREAWADR
jgi:DNA-binding FadR family transcriptional regulator